MKLIIEEELIIPKNNLDIEYTREILNKFCIYAREEDMSFIIIPQKCVLDEIDMNTLFHDVLSFVPRGYRLSYAGLGGTGCAMSLSIWNYRRVFGKEVSYE